MDRGDRVARREVSQLDAPVAEEGAAADEERVRPLVHKRREGGVDVGNRAGVENPELQSHGAGSGFHVPQVGGGNRRFRRIDERSHTRGCGHQRPQELQPLRRQLCPEEIDPGHVAARPGEARDKTKRDRVFGNHEHDGNRRGRLGRGQRRGRAGHGDDVDAPANEVGRQHRQPIGFVLAPAIFDRNVLTLNIAALFEALAKCAQSIRVPIRC